jgi:hypothetical protein
MSMYPVSALMMETQINQLSQAAKWSDAIAIPGWLDRRLALFSIGSEEIFERSALYFCPP